MDEPIVRVGIMYATEVTFCLQSPYFLEGITDEWKGWQQVVCENGRLKWKDNSYDVLTFIPRAEEGKFLLNEVTIGVDFHWERKESQCFEGILWLTVVDGSICVVNVIKLERYLSCVIASEMSATASLSFLRAHAVISRSWLLSQIAGNKKSTESYPFIETAEERIKWYDRDDHQFFDVCADDHCQRYQGCGRLTHCYALQAVQDTYGEVLMYGEEICDARFSKCCGGTTELFEHCWEPVHHPYLESVPCGDEQNACFCNTNDPKILSQVLNGFDQETTSFYRWEKEYSQKELSDLFFQKSGLDVGLIQDLIPLTIGASGRIARLKVCGDKKQIVIGKELEIRRVLSDTHLYSSAFEVEKCWKEGVLFFILHGKGWGHGVGLCQIGAAVMGEKGYDYRQILQHYYKGASVVQRYKK